MCKIFGGETSLSKKIYIYFFGLKKKNFERGLEMEDPKNGGRVEMDDPKNGGLLRWMPQSKNGGGVELG